jgi:nucleoside-diphosphate-sugar epimerase
MQSEFRKDDQDSKSMKTIAVIGASGYIGKHLVAELMRVGGYEVRVLSRNKQKDLIERKFDSRVEIIEGDINDPASLQSFLKPGCTMINLLYLWEAGETANLAAIKHLLNACSVVRVSRLIHCSTAIVSGRVQNNQINEETTCRPVSEYGITKLKVERAVVEESRGHFDTVILRPTAVFGINSKSLKKVADDLVHGTRLQNYARSCLFGNRRMNLVHIANVVAAMIFLIQSARRFNGDIFIVSDDDNPNNNFASVEQCLMRAFMISDYPLPRLRLPLGILSFLLIILGRNNVNPRCNYISGKLQSLGFECPVDLDEGLVEYAAWYRSAYLSSGRGGS